ncbi:hypothetical protein HOM50_01020 [bacterium]|jgi:hypothetical protein|nr:hypothetical protein [bacterium]MBT5014972.1 hypothetical protein [bacterium]
MKKWSSFYKICLVVLLASTHSLSGTDVTTLNNNDPLPVYTTQYPYALLGINENEYIKSKHKTQKPSHMGVTITPFYQRSRCGRNTCGEKAELGDLQGQWNMLALLNDTANTNSLPCSVPILTTIGNNLNTEIGLVFGASSAVPSEVSSIGNLLETQQSQTLLQKTLGYFNVEGRYNKRGVRFVLESVVCGGFGFSVKSGISNISFCPTFVDQTSGATAYNPLAPKYIDGATTNVSSTSWQGVTQAITNNVMSQLKNIAHAIDLDICPYRKTDMEDLYGELFWRHPFQMNKKAHAGEWPKFLFIPMFVIGGSLNVAKSTAPNVAFAIPAGNNGHNSWYVRGGLSLDFYETVNFSFAAGYTAFNSKKYKRAVPSDLYQSGIFPCQVDICRKPGSNYDCSIGFNSYHFLAGSDSPLDSLSFYFQYRYMSHQKDTFSLAQDSSSCNATTYTAAQLALFMPGQLDCVSGFSVQVFNIGFNYDISPNMLLGFGAQIPYKRKGAFRSTTYAGSFEFTF